MTHSNKRWTTARLEKLRRLATLGSTASEIAGELSSTPAAIRWQANQNDILLKTEYQQARQPAGPASVTTYEILNCVCAVFGLQTWDILNSSRRRECVRARQVFAFLIHQLRDDSLTRIGRLIQRDHSTVFHAVDKVRELCRSDESFAYEVAYCELALTKEKQND